MADTHPAPGPDLTAAARTVVAMYDAGSQAEAFTHTHSQATGAVAVWAALLGLHDDPERAVGVARVHILAVDSGLEPAMRGKAL